MHGEGWLIWCQNKMTVIHTNMLYKFVCFLMFIMILRHLHDFVDYFVNE